MEIIGHSNTFARGQKFAWPEKLMNKRTVALSGLDSLSHALESYVSVMASDFTRPWSMQAIKLVFENLEASYNYDPKHPT